MNEEIRQLGALIRSKRKEKNLSLKEVENSTSIRSSHLEAIEEGRIEQFAAGIYALGFIKQYASFLGIDIEQIIQDNPAAFKLPHAQHEFTYGIGTLEARGSVSGGVKWLPSLLWAALCAGLLVLAWYLAKYLGVL